MWRQFILEEGFSGLGLVFCHLVSVPSLSIHYAYLKFMKLLVLGDEGIVRMSFYRDAICYKLENVPSLLLQTCEFMQYTFLKMRKASQWCSSVSWRRELTWGWPATLAMPDVVSCKRVLILPWIPCWVRLSCIFKTRIIEMWVALSQDPFAARLSAYGAEPCRRDAGSVLCLVQNMPSLIPQLKPSAKIDTVPLHLLVQSKIKVV